MLVKKIFYIIIFLLLPTTVFAIPFIKIITNVGQNSPNDDCSKQICLSLLHIIENANKNINFAIYGFQGQKTILNALISAKKRGVIVRGIIDKNIYNKNNYNDTYLIEKNFANIKSDYKQDKKTKHKIKKKWFIGNLMHNKFFIIDNKYIWTGSANISNNGTGGYNTNNIALIKSKIIANKYLLEFKQMFFKQKFHKTKKILKKKLPTNINNQQLNIYFSPQDQTIDKAIIPLIKQAKKSIDISMFSLTHKGIEKALIYARKKGVFIRIILDATGAANKYSIHKNLRKNNILVKVENWGGKMHMKSAMIDSKHFIIGSMNWSKAGTKYNDENTIIIKNFKNSLIQQKIYQIMWESIDNKWLFKDVLAESYDSYKSCWDNIDNDFDGKIDANDKNCQF